MAESRAVVAADRMAQGPAAEPPVKLVYRVKRGDTLASVARLFKTTVSALRGWNRLSTDRLMPGTRLTVYTRASNRP